MRRPPPRRLLAALAAATLVLLALDVAGGPGPGLVRAAGAAAFGPLERLATPGSQASSAATAAAAARSAADRAAAARLTGETQRLASLLDAPPTRGARFIPARVVAVGVQGASGPERVTIDAGSRDGLSVDLTVVNEDGLVGRVLSVAPWTSDVLVVGGAGLTVGVRVGSAGTLGSVGGTPGARPRPAGQLGLALVQRGRVAPGDAVTTLGSVDGRPFQPGIPVGTVADVDPGGGRLAPSGSVLPAVDVTRLDVVGVLLSAPRSSPRVPVTGGGG